MSVAEQVKAAVVSDDGTRIDVWRGGVGPPLVLIHGTSADHTRWDAVRGPLEARFSVHAMDRRREPDGAVPYAIEREVEDLLAVMRAAGPRPRVVAHSFGALVALEAAARTDDIERLVLYEGGFTSSDKPEWEPIVAKIERIAREGRREEAVEVLMRELVLVRDVDIEAMRRSPTWQARIAAVHVVPREVRALMRYRFSSATAAGVRVPTLLLVGSEDPGGEHEDAATVAKALPNARVVVLPGQGHVAMDTAPELFVREVLDFLS